METLSFYDISSQGLLGSVQPQAPDVADEADAFCLSPEEKKPHHLQRVAGRRRGHSLMEASGNQLARHGGSCLGRRS